MQSLLYVGVKDYFVSLSCMFLEKTLLKIWLNLGLNLKILRETGLDLLMESF